MLYSQQDIQDNRLRARKEALLTAVLALPFLAAAIAGFVVRAELLCIAGCALLCAVVILMTDLRLMPVVRYGRFLQDVQTGLSRTTAGTLVRLGQDEGYQDGVYFRELILNIYEDLSEEGERRFLLEWGRPCPHALVGRDVAVTSHGNFVLDVRPLGRQEQEVQA